MAPEQDVSPPLEIAANRRMRKWSLGELAGRFLWEYAGSLVFALIPRPLWMLRRQLLRAFGARIGCQVHVFPSVRIAIPWNLRIDDHASVGDRVIIYNLGPLVIGAAATVSHGAHLCGGTHDFRRADLPLVKSAIAIGAGAWICADAYVGPGVTVGELAVIGARAVAVKDVVAREIVVGNPARRVGIRELVEH